MGLFKVYGKRTLRIPLIPIFLFIFPLVIMTAILFKQYGVLDSSIYQDSVAHPLVAGLSVVIILVVAVVNLPIIIVNAKTTNLLKRLKFSKVEYYEYYTAIFWLNFSFALVAEFALLTEAKFIFHVDYSSSDIFHMFLPFFLTYAFYYVIGICIAGFCNNMEQNQVIVLPTYFALLFLSGSFIPFTSLPEKVGHYFIEFNPFYFFPELMNNTAKHMHFFSDVRVYSLVALFILSFVLIQKKYQKV